MIAQVVECTTTRVVWISLESTYASISQARLIQTQLQLASLKKGADSISVYFRRAKTLADTMVATGRALTTVEFVPYLLSGLGPVYDTLVSSVVTCLDPIAPKE